jgi:hypothetical protein
MDFFESVNSNQGDRAILSIVVRNRKIAIVDQDTFNKAQERLYWSSAARWKKGIYRINKVSRTIKSEIYSMFLQKGFDEDTATRATEKFPVVYAITGNDGLKPNWYFTISEHLKEYKLAIAVSVNLENKKLIDKIFLIPTDDFYLTNSLVFSEQNEEFKKFMVNEEDIEKSILSVAEQFKNLQNVKLSN